MIIQKAKMLRWTAIIVLTIVFTSTIMYGQPSSSINFVFRLYDNEEVVDKDKFCNEWTILNGCGGFISPCDKNTVASFYDTSSKYFYIYIGAIYPPYIFTLVHQKDTMTIYFPTKSYLVCDSLTIQNGSFLFDYSCPAQDKIKLNRISGLTFCPLNNIDWIVQRQKFERSVYYKED